LWQSRWNYLFCLWMFFLGGEGGGVVVIIYNTIVLCIHMVTLFFEGGGGFWSSSVIQCIYVFTFDCIVFSTRTKWYLPILYCLSFFYLRLLITLLVYFNFFQLQFCHTRASLHFLETICIPYLGLYNAQDFAQIL
jgi:hypothetical protein